MTRLTALRTLLSDMAPPDVYLLSTLLNILRSWLLSRSLLALENAALRQQLVTYKRTHKRPRLRTEDRLFWVALRRIWSAWDRSLAIVKPETVIAWHRQGFKLLWRRRSHSAKIGRPRIPCDHINFASTGPGAPSSATTARPLVLPLPHTAHRIPRCRLCLRHHGDRLASCRPRQRDQQSYVVMGEAADP